MPWQAMLTEVTLPAATLPPTITTSFGMPWMMTAQRQVSSWKSLMRWMRLTTPMTRRPTPSSMRLPQPPSRAAFARLLELRLD
jgi:hypothetical protein